MNIQEDGFEWDEGNIAKCQKHGLSLEEIEAFFRSKVFVSPDVKHSGEEERFLAVGSSRDGKPMFVVFTLRDNLIRPISARYMHKKEAQNYEENFT
jgi:uncharacterized DUF497 family protein